MQDERLNKNEELEEILAEYRKKKKPNPEASATSPLHAETRVVEAKTRVELPPQSDEPQEEEEDGI